MNCNATPTPHNLVLGTFADTPEMVADDELAEAPLSVKSPPGSKKSPQDGLVPLGRWERSMEVN